MDENGFTYRLYTIADLKNWLFHNENNGLSDAVIARPRALAFVTDPHAQPEDAALAVVFNDHDEPVGYTGAFPEKWVRPEMSERYFWGSTQWMDPMYRGRGVSWKMMRQIKDGVNDKYVALDSSVASCRLDEKQGSVISYYPRYFIVMSGVDKGVKSKLKSRIVKKANKKALENMQTIDYTNRHINWIDDETYAFIVNHSNHDLFLRQQDYLNWQVRNPFFIATEDDPKSEKENCEFGGCLGRLYKHMIQVRFNGMLCGFYVLNMVDSLCSVYYLYYDDAFRKQVFASLVSIVLRNDSIARFRTFNKDLFDFMLEHGVRSMHSRDVVERVSLTVPSGFEVDSSLRLQGGDGDMI